MTRSPAPRIRCLTRRLVLVVAAVAILPTTAFGIEMFTYFGDGSRIGLPNLEVPIEAYPGIPLRSDRIRARRRAQKAAAAAAVRPGPQNAPARSGGMTIRALPPLTQPVPVFAEP